MTSGQSLLKVKKFAYLIGPAVLLLPALSFLLGAYLGISEVQAWFSLLMLLFVTPMADFLLGKDEYNPNEQEQAELAASRYFDHCLKLVVPLQFFNVLFGAYIFQSGHFEGINQFGWLMSCGLISGAVAINTAHELVHRDGKFEPFLGGLLLSTVSYATFKVEHLRGHHVNVATPEDASSSRKGEGVYAFLLRAIPNNVKNAWRLEAIRLNNKGLPWYSLYNELIVWTALSALFALSLFLYWGISGLAFFIGQSFFAIVTLEIINYIEHYGLERKRLPNGKYERVNHRHSWNSSFLLTNILLWQLQRHSDHHMQAKRRYQLLSVYPDSPQLPAGYATMFILALVPWAWRRVVDPILESHQADTNKLAAQG